MDRQINGFLIILWRVLLRTIVAWGIVISFAHSETHDQRIKKCEAIPVAVPAFSCKGDGSIVPKTIDAQGHCSKPEDLYSRCVYQSTLGQLAKGNTDGVEILYSCRKKPDGKNTYKNDKTDSYYDIAVIQHDPKTGNTCFYQHLGDTSGKSIPAPNKDTGGKFWNEKPDFCTSCHSNGPFVRSPHYADVKDGANKVILPDVYRRKPGKHSYKVLHDHFKVYDVDRKGNDCTLCHSIGAYESLGITPKKRIGMVNYLAAGSLMSLRESRTSGCYSPLKSGKCPSPTKSGYHDFMVGMMGIDAAGAKAAVKELEECVNKKPMPRDCTLTKLSP
ncbi:hypothetical protein GCM10008090_29440 [Arenicella chitinivorans]|uniref:Uncharacterized protein n=1 Tax=Arenicella chitinivorans TaxID=1329800 RepID=A0A918S0B6_9GAMM|nr:hypothetical protein [Arenicella chitinivorans]GHA17846.1 hypothetical protein GCM10008090_29440 [Arenicella chitinivorans]